MKTKTLIERGETLHVSRSSYAERYATNLEFREREKAKARKQHQAHREQRLAQRRAWYVANREAVLMKEAVRRSEYQERYATDPEFRERKKALARKSHHARRDKILAQRRADYAANREAIQAKEAIRRADPAARERARQRSAEWYRLHPGHHRQYHVKRKYGLTVDALQEMLADQQGSCAICGSKESGHKHGVFVVDHDHETGAIRGLLCSLCNLTLGQFKDDPQRFRAAADYLEAHQANRKASKVA